MIVMLFFVIYSDRLCATNGSDPYKINIFHLLGTDKAMSII